MTIILHSACHCRLQVFLFCRFPKPYRQKKSRFQPAGYGVRRPWNALPAAVVIWVWRPPYNGRQHVLSAAKSVKRRSKRRERARRKM